MPATFSFAIKGLQQRAQGGACLSVLQTPACLEVRLWHRTLEETQHFLLAADTMSQRSKIVESGPMMPVLIWLPDMQERTLVDTGVWLDHCGGIRPGDDGGDGMAVPRVPDTNSSGEFLDPVRS